MSITISLARGEQKWEMELPPKPQMPYKNFYEVVLAVRHIYEGAELISRADDGGCVYSHRVNGIGCAIGCLFPDETASTWDAPPHESTTEAVMGTGLGELFEKMPGIEEDFRKVMDLDDIDVNDLAKLQQAHDNSNFAVDFITKLELYLVTRDMTYLWH